MEVDDEWKCLPGGQEANRPEDKWNGEWNGYQFQLCQSRNDRDIESGEADPDSALSKNCTGVTHMRNPDLVHTYIATLLIS